jgi:hypothetical protein
MREKNAREAVRNLSVTNPELAIKRIDNELALRKDGSGSDFQDVDSEDLHNAKQLAESTMVSNSNADNEEYELNVGQASTDITQWINDGTATEARILAMPIDVPPSQRRKLEEWREGKMALVRGIEKRKAELQNNFALADDYTVLDELDSLVDSVEGGGVDTVDAMADLNRLAGTATKDGVKAHITEATYNKYRGLVNARGKDAIKKQVDSVIGDVRNVYVTRWSDAEARQIARTTGRDLTSTERRQAQSIGYLIQVGKHQTSLFEKAYEQALRNAEEPEKGKGKRVVSGDEARSIGAKEWERFQKKTQAQRMDEFNVFSGQQLPMPEGFNRSLWNSMSSQHKASAHSLLAGGSTIKQVEDIAKR